MKKIETLNKKEQKRLMVLNQEETGKMADKRAAEVSGFSLRQVRRILAAYRKEGAAAYWHMVIGKESPLMPWTAT